MSKKSIRSFNDRVVRAVCNEDYNKRWLSVTDIVRVINDDEDYVKGWQLLVMAEKETQYG